MYMCTYVHANSTMSSVDRNERTIVEGMVMQLCVNKVCMLRD